METTDKVLETMKKAKEPLNAKKIEELTGLSKAEVDKAMKKLKDEDKIISNKRCFWEPK